MPTNRDFKRLVRARMEKTGEAYTTARAQLLQKNSGPPSRKAPKPAAAPSVSYANLGGKSDAVIKTNTGHTWEEWVQILDHVNAHEWAHGRIAEFVVEQHGVPG